MFLKQLIDQANQAAINSIIRPQRARYKLKNLPYKIDIQGYPFPVFRQNITFKNSRKQKLVGSYFAPTGEIENPPCVIYLHGNASCQVEGFFLVPIFIPFGCSVLCFDCSGSGNSEGELISLGYHESDDVLCAIKFLRERYKVGKIALWGRSMGAATSLITISKDHTISSAVIDSPFASLHDLAVDIGSTMPFPKFMVKIYVNYMRRKIQTVAGFNIDDVEPIKDCSTSTTPLFIIHGANDTFIPCEHSKRIFDAYGGPKHIELVPGNHNSQRPQEVIVMAVQHIANAFGIEIDVDAIPSIDDDNASFHFENAFEMNKSEESAFDTANHENKKEEENNDEINSNNKENEGNVIKENENKENTQKKNNIQSDTNESDESTNVKEENVKDEKESEENAQKDENESEGNNEKESKESTDVKEENANEENAQKVNNTQNGANESDENTNVKEKNVKDEKESEENAQKEGNNEKESKESTDANEENANEEKNVENEENEEKNVENEGNEEKNVENEENGTHNNTDESKENSIIKEGNTAEHVNGGENVV
ncbi:Clan SC, family S9, unassigned serine peptidase [Histomonas meleagridis]|uniref:Clan SC, family S9, unassigned serine peptidase n=1 Tax=Histomonas meleagridis TaxID=135588 RepID=UPI003559D6BF|nr:Clan SC, family S9, unassigned serine peptidase [Histomonas meleagridis]KAH0803863.1 Clan SC, family S9, unassigned serine peptidase [Histomonas meleagridis]